jgi:hypothetical protein
MTGLENWVGVRIILGGNNFVNTAMPPDQAHGLVNEWMNGRISQERLGQINAPAPVDGSWAVEVKSIQAIHTFSLQVQQPPPPVAPANQFSLRHIPPGASGVHQ